MSLRIITLLLSIWLLFGAIWYFVAKLQLFSKIKQHIHSRKEKREEAKLELARKEREKYQSRKKLIEDYLDKEYKKATEERSKEFQKRFDYAEEVNSTCPKCGSKNVINLIRGGKTDTNGEKNNGTYSFNKCKDCDNEWNVSNPTYPNLYLIFSPHSSMLPLWLCYRIDDYLSIKFDPYDKTEEFNSIEEKKDNLINRSRSQLKEYKNSPRYMLEYAVFEEMTSFGGFFDEDAKKRIGISEKVDEFSYVFPDEVWNVVKELIGWNGEEK